MNSYVKSFVTRPVFASLFAAAMAAPALAHDHGGEPSSASPALALEGRTLQADDHLVGAADADAELVIYASVTCGHCGQWFTEDWPEVKARLVEAGHLRVALREFPTSPAQVAVAGFMIANCAGPDRYWSAIEHQFAQQGATRAAFARGEGRAAFDALAAQAGVADVQACMGDDAQFARIDRAMARGEAAGVSSVPAFFLDGEPLDAYAADDIAEALGVG